MTNMFDELQRLFDTKMTVYSSMGMASSNRGRVYFNIWGSPSNKILAQGYGDTFEDAMRDALSKIPGAKPAPTLPGMEPLTTRPLLPGMTR